MRRAYGGDNTNKQRGAGCGSVATVRDLSLHSSPEVAENAEAEAISCTFTTSRTSCSPSLSLAIYLRILYCFSDI